VAVCAGVPEAYALTWRSVERGGTVLVFAPGHPEAAVPIPLWDLWRAWRTFRYQSKVMLKTFD